MYGKNRLLDAYSIWGESPLSGLLVEPKNIFYRRTDAIEEQLKNSGFNIKTVYRHTVYNKNFYVLIFEDVQEERDIAESLSIPEEWVGFITTDPWMYYVKEDELNDKYCDADGELVFPSVFAKIKEIYEDDSSDEDIVTCVKKGGFWGIDYVYIIGLHEDVDKLCEHIDRCIDEDS